MAHGKLPDPADRPCLSASAISVRVAPAHNRIPAPPIHKAKNTVHRPLEAEVRYLQEDER
jgi:hypothetical protein